MAYIYVHINTITGQAYIGKTSGIPERRWNKGRGYQNVQNKFYQAIQKYGWNSFIHVILEKNVPEYLIDDLETTYIHYYKTNIYGYNVLKGNGKILSDINLTSLPTIYYNDKNGILRSRKNYSTETPLEHFQVYNDNLGILRTKNYI